MMINKRGETFLNIVELVIFGICIFFAMFFYSIADVSNQERATQNVEEFQFEHKSVQALRTLAQTTLEVNGQSMTFSQATNEYMERVDYLTQDITPDQRREAQRELTDYQEALQVTARNTILPLFAPSTGNDARLILTYVILDTPRHELIIGEFSKARAQDHEQIEETSIQLPAYFEHSGQPPGSYYLLLSVGEQRDLTPLRGTIT